MNDRPARWISVGTPVKTRVNIFCVEKENPRHVASVVSASSKHFSKFKQDVELMRLAPELYTLVKDAQDLLDRLRHINDPQTLALRKRIISAVAQIEVQSDGER